MKLPAFVTGKGGSSLILALVFVLFSSVLSFLIINNCYISNSYSSFNKEEDRAYYITVSIGNYLSSITSNIIYQSPCNNSEIELEMDKTGFKAVIFREISDDYTVKFHIDHILLGDNYINELVFDTFVFKPLEVRVENDFVEVKYDKCTFEKN